MKDIPVFTTDDGVSSLVLKEIPYKGVAFIRVQDVQPGCLDNHLSECIGFCRAAGAERVLASGNPALEQYPLDSIVYQMTLAGPFPATQDRLWPVTEETVGRWRELYNKGMGPVDNHATLSFFDEKNILSSAGAYFVHAEEKLLGIGWMEGNSLLALVSAQPGMGERTARALLSTVTEDRVTLEVVSKNHRAIRLYERMGFIKSAELRRWYRVL